MTSRSILRSRRLIAGTCQRPKFMFSTQVISHWIRPRMRSPGWSADLCPFKSRLVRGICGPVSNVGRIARLLVFCPELPGPTPSHTPQSARREDEGEAPEPAESPKCPDEEKAAGRCGDLAVMCPPHVDDGHGCRQQSDEQHDDVPRSPFGEHERPVQEDRQDEQRNV